MGKPFLLFFILLFFVFSCSEPKKVSNAFYYWKTVFNLDEKERSILKEHHINRLYLRMFDVDWNAEKAEALPVAHISFNDSFPAEVEIVPVIYITNKTMEKISGKEVDRLAENMLALTGRLMAKQKATYREIQLDCDWTVSTKEKYFELIRQVKKRSAKQVSATIRLHQVKFPERTGVPPVDRGMLMFYNMGKLEETEHRNSIFNKEDAAKYVESLEKYTLQMDVALPVFSWGVKLRGRKVKSLLNNLSLQDAESSVRKAGFRKLNDHVFIADSGFFFRGEYFLPGERLSMEEITPQICKEAAEMLRPYQKTTNFSLALYHFDSSVFNRYKPQELEEIYSSFN
jgi:hypothetical protein